MDASGRKDGRHGCELFIPLAEWGRKDHLSIFTVVCVMGESHVPGKQCMTLDEETQVCAYF